MKRRGLLAWIVGGALGGALALVSLSLGACNTPFIPIPPPGDPSFTPIVIAEPMGGGSRTAWEISGGPQPAMGGARVFVYNASLGEGVIARAGLDGSYVAGPLEGKVDDRIELFYETAKGDRSPGICRSLQAGVARAPCP